MTTIFELGKEIDKRREELSLLEKRYRDMFDDNETLMDYYSERAFYEDEMKPYQKRMEELNKLIYLEEIGIDTEKELESAEEYGISTDKAIEILYNSKIGDENRLNGKLTFKEIMFK